MLRTPRFAFILSMYSNKSRYEYIIVEDFRMKKIISILLAALMVTGAFAAPKKKGKRKVAVKVGVSMPTKDLQRWKDRKSVV